MANITNLQHGHHLGGKPSPTYRAWLRMWDRVRGYTDRDRKHYSERGIAVCDRWKEFENFLEDMGFRPEGMTLDRKDNDKGYSKENCRWATMKDQGRNRSSNRNVTFNEETLCLSEWAERTGIDKRTLRSRLEKGWSVEDALTVPTRPKRPSGAMEKNNG